MGSFSEENRAGAGSPDGGWTEDLLGDDYQKFTLPLGPDPDNETDVEATLVRHLPTDSEQGSTNLSDFSQRPALLWIHGMTDYFFHTEFAEFFHSQGYAVYGLDLRKCGRSHRPGQQWHYTTDLSHYFPDLTAALDILSATHPAVIPVGHSTGGLIAPLWLDQLRTSDPDRHSRVSALVLNSPWLAMMYPSPVVRIIGPVIDLIGRKKPLWTLPRDGLGTYGRSIHRDHLGEWDFDMTMKPVEGHPKKFGWLRAVMAGHRSVQSGQVNVGVSVLTLSSARSWFKREQTPEVDSSDTVLDIRHMEKYSPMLNSPPRQVTIHQLDGARHDVFLSRKPVREEAMRVMLNWLTSF